MAHSSRDGTALLLPLLAGCGLVLFTVLIHAAAVVTIIRMVRREERLSRAGISFFKDVSIVAGSVLVAFAAHLIEMAAWAAVFMWFGEFSNFDSAFYLSAEN